MKSDSPNWKGSSYNVKILWEDNSETWEPLLVIKVDDPITCAEYADKMNFLNTHGWKSLKKHAKNKKKLARLLKQAKLKWLRREPIYEFGIHVPRDTREARYLERKEGHTRWSDAKGMEIAQLNDYKAFMALGDNAKVPQGYQKI